MFVITVWKILLFWINHKNVSDFAGKVLHNVCQTLYFCHFRFPLLSFIWSYILWHHGNRWMALHGRCPNWWTALHGRWASKLPQRPRWDPYSWERIVQTAGSRSIYSRCFPSVMSVSIFNLKLTHYSVLLLILFYCFSLEITVIVTWYYYLWLTV